MIRRHSCRRCGSNDLKARPKSRVAPTGTDALSAEKAVDGRSSVGGKSAAPASAATPVHALDARRAYATR